MGHMEIERRLTLFAGKRVFLTGDTGFKGAWLSLWLHELGAEIVGFAQPPVRDYDLFNVLGLEMLIHHVDGDIRDFDHLHSVIKEFKPEFLFHLAAQSLVRPSYDDPKKTFDTNIGGSVNILDAIRRSSSIKSVILVTSDKCYRNREWIWGYRENDELGGHDPYSASKSGAEIVFSSYMNSFFNDMENLGAASVRAGNVIGGGDWAPERLMPDCIRALSNGQPITLRNPASTRPWQHVLEPLYGYMQLALQLYYRPKEFSGSWNFGPETESFRTVKDLTEKILFDWGKGEICINPVPDSRHESDILHLNCDKAHHVLGWYPCWSFERSVSESVKWYKGVNSGTSAIAISKKQIEDYMEDRKL